MRATRKDVAKPTAKGTEKYMNAAILSVMIWASSDIVPSKPARIVVISKDQASHANDNATDIASLTKGIIIGILRFFMEIVGIVSTSSILFHRM